MRQKQFIKEFRKFYRKEISNSRKSDDILKRELIIERLLDKIIWNCYEINNGELEEKFFIENEYAKITTEIILEADTSHETNYYYKNTYKDIIEKTEIY